MSVPALTQAGVSSNPSGLRSLRLLAAVVLTALACAACDKTPEAPPPPTAPGQVPEGTTFDLKPQITDTVISTGDGGAKMAIDGSKPGMVTLTMPKTGTSRAQLTAVLDPGEYDVHVQVGAVDVQDRGTQGFGAFFGPENDMAGTIELKPNSDQHMHVSVPAKKQAYFALGFGGWGQARGSMEVKALEIKRAKG